MINLYDANVIKKRDEIKSLLKIFDYYYDCVCDFLKKFENTYYASVNKSLSIFNKINKTNDKKTYNQDDYRYKYCFQWIKRLRLYFENDDINIKNNIIEQINDDYFIISFLSNYNKKDMYHSKFFKLSLDTLNKKYINQNIDLYINC
jgi:hypothetical protein